MQISLPPNTQQFAPMGSLTIQLNPIYLNASPPAVRYGLKLWGINKNITFQLSQEKTQKIQTTCKYSLVFPVTTNLCKLTNYLYDMAVLAVNATDARTNKELAVGYLRLRRYIVNQIVGSFQDKLELAIAPTPNKHSPDSQGIQNINKLPVIGEVFLQMKFDVPLHGMSIPRKIANNQQQNNFNLKHDKKPISNHQKIPQPPKTGKSTRKIIQQPHPYQEIQHSNDQNHFPKYKNQPQPQIQALLNALQPVSRTNNVDSKPIHKIKVTKDNVLNFLQEDSIKNYPDLQDLYARFGRNNVNAQRMRLKLDEAKYLNPIKQAGRLRQAEKEAHMHADNGYIVRLRNLHFLVTDQKSPTQQISNLQITQYNSQKQINSNKGEMILSRNCIVNFRSNYNDNNAFYVKKISHNNCFQFESNIYKGRVVVKDLTDHVKVYMKRKDNNKKVLEFDMIVQKLFDNREQSPKKQQTYVANDNIPKADPVSKSQRSHFYISLTPQNQPYTLASRQRNPQLNFLIHPQCQKQPVSGKKMIFTADNKSQKIKIKIQNTKNLQGTAERGIMGQIQEVQVQIPSGVRMREQYVKIFGEAYRVFMASEESIQGLMRIVMQYDTKPNNNVVSDQQNRLNISQDNQSPNKPNLSNQIILPHIESRQQSLKLLFIIFQSLLQTTNSKCMQIIKKLQSLTLTQSEQLSLFQQLCIQSGVPPQKIPAATYTSFAELLHGEFSMFWNCFMQYREWNQLYWKALGYYEKQLWALLTQLFNDRCIEQGSIIEKGQTKKKIERILQKCLQKLFKSKQTLFGLIPYKVCQQILSQSLIQRFASYLNQNPSINQMESINISNVQQRIRLNRLKIQKLQVCLLNIRILTCRYISHRNNKFGLQQNDDEVHCIKINELSSIFLPGQGLDEPIYCNQHQILAIGNSLHKEPSEKQIQQSQQQLQLLFQVMNSCIGTDSKSTQINRIKNMYGCCKLRKLLKSIQEQKIQTEQSSKLEQQQNIRMNTDIHLHTEKLHTEQIQGNNPKKHIYTQQIIQAPKKESTLFPITLTDLILNPDTKKYITIPQLSGTTIEIYGKNTRSQENNSHSLYKIRYEELPARINLNEMEDYKVVVTVYESEEGREGQPTRQIQTWRFQGVFIANEKLQSVMLFCGEKEGLREIGSIKVKTNGQKHNYQQQEQQQNQKQLILQIKNTQKYQIQSPFAARLEQLQQRKKGEQAALQRQRSHITRKIFEPSYQKNQSQSFPSRSLQTSDYIAYKVLSIYPKVRDLDGADQYRITIQGVQNVIGYPNKGVLGKICNINKQKTYIEVNIVDQKIKSMCGIQKLPKQAGTHQLCFSHPDNSLHCVVTIELDTYTGQQILNNIDIINQQAHLQRVVMVNIYYLISINKFFEEGEDTTNIGLGDVTKYQKDNKQFIYTLVMMNQSDVQPIYIKTFDLHQNIASPNTDKKGSIDSSLIDQYLRCMWIGATVRVQVSKSYSIHIYKHKATPKTRSHTTQNLIAHFQYRQKFNPLKEGIFSSKGFLIDQNGYRLAINTLQINYNDVFSRDAIGRQKFESLFKIFQVSNIIKITKQIGAKGNNKMIKIEERVKKQIRSSQGWTNTQLHLLFSLQQYQFQITQIFTQWDIDLLSHQSINLQSYSILDMFMEYEMYDFKNSGLIPFKKAEIVGMLVFGKHGLKKENEEINQNIGIKNMIQLQACLVDGRQGWLVDLKNRQKDGDIDYLLVLWCLRTFSCTDNFFVKGNLKQLNMISKKPVIQGQNNSQNQNQSLSKIKSIEIQLLCFKNLKIQNTPQTLTFYLNGQKVADPIPRCFTHQYLNPKTIVTTWPVVLEVYSKKYGVKELYTQELVETIRVYDQKVSVLGGEVWFLIQENEGSISKPGNDIIKPDRIDNIQINTKKKNQENSSTNLNINTNSNPFRRSRRQKWQELKQSDESTKKIQDILKSRLTA